MPETLQCFDALHGAVKASGNFECRLVGKADYWVSLLPPRPNTYEQIGRDLTRAVSGLAVLILTEVGGGWWNDFFGCPHDVKN